MYAQKRHACNIHNCKQKRSTQEIQASGVGSKKIYKWSHEGLVDTIFKSNEQEDGRLIQTRMFI